ncbi:LPS-assembly protein LptD [Actibacterium lipolyticum]|uniref:LPS-assembly protein LptD n=1 Tax=Actibacterium lipolyticum TaxID=1524263 RepID=A0A238JV83_9RHOB|nr:LPS assembly protein LptD [Actibacterium lipolyticum]SMX34505.1 LPS-assembly protein LptD precursor [Actibacterium lipolyticum]
MFRRLALTLFMLLAPMATTAQEVPATLIADRVAVDGNDRLIAEGNVEVLYEGYRLKATRITYDQSNDRLLIDGPMTIVTADGTYLLASSADLAPDLTDGILRSARLVLDQQLQLAAAEIHRVGGRYSVLQKTVASSCKVCDGSQIPLWQIRASRIIHDEDEQQLYFDHARLELLGLPVFYLPRLRLPDPSLKRANGFLIPSLRITDSLGPGLKVPYFITLGQHADLTVTPYFSTSQTRTVELRFRKAFRRGEIELNGAFSRDDLVKGEIRRYVFAEGSFDLPRDFKLDFAIKSVSDPAYLLDYGISDADRLASPLRVSRTRRDEYIGAGLVYYTSLRDDEADNTLPGLVTNATWQRRFEPTALGGIVETELEFFGFNRRSGEDIVGRDVTRLSGNVNWRRDWVAPNGLLLGAMGELSLDYYGIQDDSAHSDPIFRSAPFAGVEMRWPMAKQTASGASHILEPIAQLVWSKTDTTGIPNEDSLSVEFDEGNLFALNRFPGTDAYEQGLRANIGVGWTRYDPTGWSVGVTAGRIFRESNLSQFSIGSGLDGINSDWMAAVHLNTAENLSLTNRAVFDDAFNFTRNEFRVDWDYKRLDLASSYVWQEANFTEDRTVDSSALLLDASYRLKRNWTGNIDWRYDFVTERAARAGLGLEYRNECVTVDLSLSRRFTSSTSVRPTTDFGLTISLNGFGTGGDNTAYTRSCTR